MEFRQYCDLDTLGLNYSWNSKYRIPPVTQPVARRHYSVYTETMEHNTLFKLVYTFILGIVIALFFGIGIAAFYEQPKPPEYESSTALYKTSEPSVEQQKIDQAQQQKFDACMKEYQDKNKSYERNVSIILLVLAVASVVVAFAATARLGFLTDGMLLGALFTLIHGLIRGFSADDNKYLFVAATVAVCVVLYLGYRRFLRMPKKSTKKRK